MSFQYATSKEAGTAPALGGMVMSKWQRVLRQWQYDAKGRPRTKLAILRRRLTRLPTLFVLVWLFVLYWGERKLFNDSIDACQWDKWENWVWISHALHH